MPDFNAEFSQFPGAANPPPNYYDRYNPRGAAFANTPAAARAPEEDLISEWLTSPPRRRKSSQPVGQLFRDAGFDVPQIPEQEDLISEWLPKPKAGAANAAPQNRPVGSLFTDAGFTLPTGKTSSPSVADARPGVDESGRPGWFVPDPNKPGRHLQVIPPSQQGLQPGEAIPAASFADRSRAITQRAQASPGGLPVALGAGAAAIGAGALAPILGPALGRGALSAAKAAGTVGKLWLAEKALETLVPEDWQPHVIRAMHAFGEAK